MTTNAPATAARPVTELLARAVSRQALRPGDGKSGSVFERAVIDGQRYFVKRVSPASDWVMRAIGDHTHRTYRIWRAGIMDRAPACIDHTVVAMEVAGDGDDAVLSVLMRDVAPYLVPEGDTVVPLEQHANFVAHLAELSAAFWGWRDEVGGLTTMAERLRVFAPGNIAPELEVDVVPGTVVAADEGWRRLPSRSPQLSRIAARVHDDPAVLARPLDTTPVTFLQGDWKMGNLGSHPRGRTILLDWALPGSGPACFDLWWYVALNRDRLPESKEATVARFRDALERLGIDTGPWWDTQLDLCVIAIMATFGWEKALGDSDELRWWEERVKDAVQRQGL